MARVTANGISGMVGNVVFYSMNGKEYVRAKPRKRTKKRNQAPNPITSIFGIVSTYGSAMIKLVNGSFLFRFNRDTYNRMRGWMRNQYAANYQEASWPLSGKSSGMCRLNDGIDLRDYLKTDITVRDSCNGNITIALPGMNPKQDIKAPLRTMKVNIKLIVVTSAFKAPVTPCNICTEQYSFIYSNNPVPAQQFVLQTNAGTGNIALVFVALEYETADTGAGLYNKDIQWLPAAAVAMGRLQ